METDAIVVGAGPTGLTAALGLSRQGLSVRVFDKGGGPSTKSKALVVQPRTLEQLRASGVADELVERGGRLAGADVYTEGERLARMTLPEPNSPYPFVVRIPQSETERALLEDLDGRDGVELEWDTEVRDVRNGEGGAEVELADGSVGRADWVLGCDGAHSTVRDRVASSFEGEAIPAWFALWDAELDFDYPMDRGRMHLHSEGILGGIPLGDSTLYRVVGILPEQPTDEEPEVDRDLLEELIDRRTTLEPEIGAVEWASSFLIQQRMVDQYRDGRIFLAGDAAHIHSPAGGQGMNTGMQDAMNLAWKIGRVERGRAGDELLDSYEDERLPVAESLLGGTGVATKLMTSENPFVKSARNRVVKVVSSFDPVQQRLVRNLMMLQIDYPDSPIVDQETDGIWDRPVVGSDASEEASLGDRIAFRRGPRSGGRAPEGPVEGIEGVDSIYDLIDDRRFLLLLFDGRAHTESGDHHLEGIRREMEDREEVRPVVVASREDRPEAFGADADVALDGDFELHEQYAAESECLYLIRPDGFIAFRQQPPTSAGLEEMLGRT